MTKKMMVQGFSLLVLASALLAACGGGDTSVDASTSTSTTTTATASATTAVQPTVKSANFVASGLASAITTTNCTLSGGTTTTCYKIVTVGAPSDHAVGPFCPTHISDGSVAGMWIESGKTYDLTGAFIANLATFYNDSGWKMFNTTTGKINVTDTQAAFEAAAQVQIPVAYNNYCVDGKMSYVNGGISRTFLIPVTPVPLSSGTAQVGMGGVGVALNGIIFDAPAPVNLIKAAHDIAALDDCGGHINPHAGYHYHGATGCGTQVASTDAHAALIGYALDGYGIFALTDPSGAEPTGLDSCRGHTDATRGYHYHVASAGENMFIGCFKGQQGSAT